MDTCWYQNNLYGITSTVIVEEGVILEFEELLKLPRDKRFPAPSNFNLKPYFTSTACWAGFVMHYKISTQDDWLYLDTMDINMDNPPLVNRRAPRNYPTLAGGYPHFQWRYEELDIPVKITGGLELGRYHWKNQPITPKILKGNIGIGLRQLIRGVFDRRVAVWLEKGQCT